MVAFLTVHQVQREAAQTAKQRTTRRVRRTGVVATFLLLITFDGHVAQLNAGAGQTPQAHVEITTETFDPAAFPLDAFGD